MIAVLSLILIGWQSATTSEIHKMNTHIKDMKNAIERGDLKLELAETVYDDMIGVLFIQRQAVQVSGHLVVCRNQAKHATKYVSDLANYARAKAAQSDK